LLKTSVMQPLFGFDVETFSAISLRKYGAYLYARHPTTDVRCVSYCLVERCTPPSPALPMVKIWFPGDPPPAELVGIQHDTHARATARAWSKYACVFAASDSGDFSEISPAIRLTSASHHLSLLFSIAVIASRMLLHASSKWRSSAWALAKCARYQGINA